MPTIENAMAAAGIQPKFMEQGAWTMACSQAIASGAASAQDYKLFPVGSGVTITDFYVYFSAGVSTQGVRMGFSEHAFLCTLKPGMKIPPEFMWVPLSELKKFPMGKVDRQIANKLVNDAYG